MDFAEVFGRGRCGACGGSLCAGQFAFIEVRRRATWPYPAFFNAITGDGPAAVALLCDACADAEATPREVVELLAGALYYHDVATLEELGPAPTHHLTTVGGQEAIYCLVCGRTSFNPDDVANLYCGHCQKFHPIQG